MESGREGIEIRRAVRTDAPGLLAIQRACFLPDLEKYGDEATNPANESLERLERKIEACLYFAVLEEGELIGGIDVRRRDERRYRLNRIFIDPARQDLGIGRFCVRRIEELFPEAEEWDLDTPHLSFRNHHLYESLGYVKVGESRQEGSLVLYEYRKAMAR
ncbi:MAG TPA: GNAT family N-acetyltransferase [Spirochaetia bacterium]|nr:GNAT family N-acetyltransferase [Spirochaetia bacterium]